MKSIFLNWKTSSAGVLLIATGIMDIVGSKAITIAALTAILGGIGLLFAPDATTTPTA